MSCWSYTGWRRNLLAFFLGVFAMLALPPFFAFPLLIPAFAGLFLLINAASTRKRIFLDGWWWGWGFYMSGLYWFCIALLTDAEKFAWLIPFALFGLTAVIAIYAGVACWLFSFTRTRGITGIFVFSVVWSVVEYARGHLFTGFPWNLQGYSFAVSDMASQLASIIGVYGLTWCAIWLATIPAAFFLVDKKRALVIVALSYIGLALTTGWGAWRLHEADLVPESERYVPGVVLRLVQANIAQHHKWDPKLQMEGLKEYMRLTHAQGLEKVTHIIWPETAVPYVVAPDSVLTRMLGTGVPEGKLLITGGLRVQGTDEQIFNSVMAIDHRGAIVSTYDKHKLVPFGEFLPFRNLLPAEWLTPVGAQDFSSGPGPRTVTWSGLPPASPLICYEAIFPELAAARESRPQWLLNVTNDAWFGLSSGPYQHFHMARLRSIELGLPLVRVANTGITAVTDSYGRIEQQLALGTQGVLDIRLQKPQPYATTYYRYPNILLLILVFMGLILTKRQRIYKKN